MHVKVVRSEFKEGQRKDGSVFRGTSAVVIFGDSITARKVYISDEVIDPQLVVSGGVYDMYHDQNGTVHVFDIVSVPEGASK